jgi:hypothetical protein
MIGMIQMSTPRQRTFCEVIGQKLLVEMLATIQSPLCASSPLMTSSWPGTSRRNVAMSSAGSGSLAANIHRIVVETVRWISEVTVTASLRPEPLPCRGHQVRLALRKRDEKPVEKPMTQWRSLRTTG